jgi:hypothetical protein
MPGTTNHLRAARSDTRAVTIDAPAADVFAFVADPENLPRWAVGFCRAIRRDPEKAGQWIVSTAHGDLPIRFVTDSQRGTVDFYLTPTPAVEAAAFSRVMPNGLGAEYVFTQFQAPGMPDEVFDGQVQALVEELQVLRSLIQARIACPT